MRLISVDLWYTNSQRKVFWSEMTLKEHEVYEQKFEKVQNCSVRTAEIEIDPHIHCGWVVLDIISMISWIHRWKIQQLGIRKWQKPVLARILWKISTYTHKLALHPFVVPREIGIKSGWPWPMWQIHTCDCPTLVSPKTELFLFCLSFFLYFCLIYSFILLL